jgi:hypothetical protein
MAEDAGIRMKNPIISVTRVEAFARDEDALRPLVMLCEVLVSSSLVGGLWTSFRGRHCGLGANTFEPLLAEGRWIHAARANQPTHVVPICSVPSGPGEVGTISVSVRPHASPSSAPGLVLFLSLSVETFDTSSDALAHLLERCVDAVDADAALIGPREWLRGRAGWATFTRKSRRDLLHVGGVLVPTRSGVIVVAHTEDPASELTAARESAFRVRNALLASPRRPDQEQEGTPPLPISREPVLHPPVPANPPQAPWAIPTAAPPPFHHPGPRSPLSAEPDTNESTAVAPAARKAPGGLAGTALALDVPRGAALPFAKSTGVAPPAAAQQAGGQSLPRVVRPPAHLSGTSLTSDVPRRPELPFARDVGAVPGHLTVDQYALLRALLAVKGEDDQETWQQFGLISAARKNAVQVSFAAMFKQDPAAQARFVELVPRLIAQLRPGGAGR